jgi:molybdate transport system permease protein
MWRVDARGVSMTEQGRHTAVVERVYESHGETRVAVRLGTALLHCRAPSDADARAAFGLHDREGRCCRVDIAAGATTVWPVMP